MRNPTVVLIHGAWHSSACWTPLLPYLPAGRLRILTPDLPGHGGNAADPSRISLNFYSKYISQLIDIYDDIFIIGHSMGGMVISQVAETIPDKIAKLIYLAAYLPQNGQSLFDLMECHRKHHGETEVERALRFSANKRLCSIPEERIATLFYNRCTPAQAARAAAATRAQATLPLAGRVRLSRERFGTVPKAVIQCRDDRVIPLAQQHDMLAGLSCDTVLELDTDHSPFLSAPAGLAALLNREFS